MSTLLLEEMWFLFSSICMGASEKWNKTRFEEINTLNETDKPKGVIFPHKEKQVLLYPCPSQARCVKSLC